MTGLWTIASIKQTPIRVHWSTILLPLGVLAYTLYYDITPSGIVWLQLFVLAVLVCVLLHELGHAIAARYYNVRVHDIILLPIGGAARLKKLPPQASQEAMVAFAGPLVNAAIALLLMPAMLLWPAEDWWPWLSNYTIRSFTVCLAFFNAGVFIFNLLPVFPLDGGRLLRAGLSTRMSRLQATKAAAGIARVIALLAVGYAVYDNSFFIGGFAMYAFFAAGREVRTTRVNSFLTDHTLGSIAVAVRVFDPETSIADVYHQLLRNQQRGAVIADECSPLGFVTLEMLDADTHDRYVADLELITVLCHDSDAPLSQISRQFSNHPRSVAIEEIDHRPVGWADYQMLEDAFEAFAKTA